MKRKSRVVSAAWRTLVAVFLLDPVFSHAEPVGVVLDKGHLFALANVRDAADQEFAVYFLVDTGTSSTLINPDNLPQATWDLKSESTETFRVVSTSATVWGAVGSESTTQIPGLQLGDSAFSNVEVTVFEGRSTLYSPTATNDQGVLCPVLGILGADLLFSKPLHLSVAAKQLEWSETPPWEADAVVPLTGMGEGKKQPQVAGVFPGQEAGTAFLLDSGTFVDLAPQDLVRDVASREPRRWLTVVEERDGDVSMVTSTTHGFLVRPDPLSNALQARVPMAGMSTFRFPFVSLGLTSLSGWDLWFTKNASGASELWIKRVPPHVQDEFLGEVDLSSWGFPRSLRGFGLAPDLTIAAVFQWGDGTPLVPDLELDDSLVSIAGEPVGSSGLDQLDSDRDVTLGLIHADGTPYTTTSRRTPLF